MFKRTNLVDQLHTSIGKLKDRIVGNIPHRLLTVLTIVKRGIHPVLSWVLEEDDEKQQDNGHPTEPGRIQFTPQPVDMMKLIQTTLPSFKAVTGQRTLQVELSPVPELSADPDCIVEVLGVLVRNAAKLTQETGTITIGLKKEDGQVVVSVKDDGREIPEEELSRVLKFSPRDKKDDRPTGRKTGLALCKKIVELHKGSIYFYSEAGKGNQVTFTLPV